MATLPLHKPILNRVLDSITDPLILYDRDFRIVMANQALESIYRRSPGPLVGRRCHRVFYGRESACEECHIRELFRTGEPQMREKVIRLPDGRVRQFEIHAYPVRDEEGRIVQAVEHSRDVAERRALEDRVRSDDSRMKRIESELRTAKDFSEKIIDNITDNLIVIDPRTHFIVQANASFRTRVGLTMHSLLEQPCYRVMLDRETPCWEDGIYCPVRVSASTRSPAQCDKVYRNAEGQERMLHIHTYPLLGDSGEAEQVIRLERDVTERRRMEEALAFRTRELERTQRQLETLFQVSRRVGAESSLQGIVCFLQDFAEGIFPDSEPIFLLLETAGDRFLFQEERRPDAIHPLQALRGGPEGDRTLSELAHHLRTIHDPRIRTSGCGEDGHPLLQAIAKRFPSWFGLPILVRKECIGYFLLGSKKATDYPPEDLRFFQGLFAQIAGQIRNLILREMEIGRLGRDPGEPVGCGDIIGQSKRIREIYDLIDLVASSDATVLITGENGTGKELVARAIHQQNVHRRGPFVVANCSAYSQSLLESELFGHEKGAFTGAIRQKKGRIERARGGTLFLDEIGDISLATQVLLLRFLQDRCFERVGGEETIESDVRVIAATNRDLHREVEEGRFRDDLYYRVNVFSIHLPPLRERKEDIPILARHFLARFSGKEGKAIPRISSDVMQALMDFPWPGNVRQLENALSYAVILCQADEIGFHHLPSFLRESSGGSPGGSLSDMERRLIQRTLEESSWNKHEAARRLRVSRSTLYSKIRRYALERKGRSG